jgi:hypothetical protein
MGGSPCRVVVAKEQTLQKRESYFAMPPDRASFNQSAALFLTKVM